MDIWNWLDPWWAWWVGFTDLFDWAAIAAVATSLAVMVALGTTLFQERRVRLRAEAAGRALHKGVVDTLRKGSVAMDEACEVFYPAGEVDRVRVRKAITKVERTRRLIALFVAREVEPNVLMGLLQMDDHLAEATELLTQALLSPQGSENAQFNGELNQATQEAELLFMSLARSSHAATPA